LTAIYEDDSVGIEQFSVLPKRYSVITGNSKWGNYTSSFLPKSSSV